MSAAAANDSSDSLVIACPTDAALNRVPRDKLGEQPKCGTCHNPLFQGRRLRRDLSEGGADRSAASEPLQKDRH